MATSRDNLFTKLSGSYWNAGVTFERTNPVPLEKYSVFKTKEQADEYALTNVVAYPGQTVAVVDAAGTTMYYIDNDGTLKALASGGDASAIQESLTNEISARKADDTYLSSEISTLQTTTLPTLSATLNQNLSIDVKVEAGTEEGVLSTYTISQGGVDKAVKINIPKDKVVTNAAVITFATDDDAAAAAGTGSKAGTYLKLTIQNGQDVYVPVPELVNTYSGLTSDTIKVDVVHGDGEEYSISAVVNAKSIGAEHLTDALSTVINNVITSDADVRATVAEISGDGEKSFKYADVQLSNALTSQISSISSTVNSAVEAEETRATGVENDLSTAIKNKIKVDDEVVETLNVTHISQADYHDKVVAKTIDPNTVYIVSSDNLSLYGGRVVEMADGVDLSDAVNVKQLSAVSAILMDEITDSVENGIDELSAKVFNGETSLSAVLHNAITAEADRADKAEQFLSGKIDTINGAGAGSISAAAEITLNSAKAYTNSVSSALSTDYVQKIADALTAVADGYVPLSVAEAATESDKLVKFSTLTGTADALSTYSDNRLTAAIQNISADTTTIAEVSSTVTAYKQEDGKLTFTKSAIQISEDQVTGLTTDLNNRVLTADFETWKNDTGLSAAGTGTDNQVVLWKDVKDITTAMHFRGAVTSTDETTVDQALAALTSPKAGDVVIDTTTSKEYVCVSVTDAGVATWRELGDESTYKTKSEFNDWETNTLNPQLVALSTDLSAETTRATGVEEGLRTDLNTLSTYTHALSVSQLVWDIDIINCGSAAE